jgi:glyceraldehyde 3-phosphate dehydrogenase
MQINVGINGFGRIGHLVFKILSESHNVNVIHINDPSGDPITHAHLLNYDSVHGRWSSAAIADHDYIEVNGHRTRFSAEKSIEETDWSGCDIIIESSGRIKNHEQAAPFYQQGVKRVIVSAPIKEEGILNVVMGVNDALYDPAKHKLLTAASCTTNCLAPVVKVIHENLNIIHGSITTIHAVTNTQPVLDAPFKDLRRARAASLSMIPTTTGAAAAIGGIFPDLKGKLNGHAVRVPMVTASLTDAVFEVEKSTTAEAVNALFKKASETTLKGILGYEEKPLVSADYTTDSRSSIIDALSTMVIHDTQVKVYSWYDNEWGYSNRLADLVKKVGAMEPE